jgi:hypothetical protein
VLTQVDGAKSRIWSAIRRTSMLGGGQRSVVPPIGRTSAWLGTGISSAGCNMPQCSSASEISTKVAMSFSGSWPPGNCGFVLTPESEPHAPGPSPIEQVGKFESASISISLSRIVQPEGARSSIVRRVRRNLRRGFPGRCHSAFRKWTRLRVNSATTAARSSVASKFKNRST